MSKLNDKILNITGSITEEDVKNAALDHAIRDKEVGNMMNKLIDSLPPGLQDKAREMFNQEDRHEQDGS